MKARVDGDIEDLEALRDDIEMPESMDLEDENEEPSILPVHAVIFQQNLEYSKGFQKKNFRLCREAYL